MRTVDAHHHFWRIADMPPPWHEPNRAAIQRDYGPDELSGHLEKAGVDATIVMQASETAAENDRLVEYAAEVPFVAGVVAWLPLADAAAAQAELDRLSDAPAVRGARCLIDRTDADWLVSPATVGVLRELAQRGMSWDIVPVTPRQVEHVRRIAETLPELRIVADHLARPPLETAGWEPWASHVRALAAHPNIAIKISIGIDLLDAWEPWDASGLDRYLGWVIDHFGPERMLLASNWPVVELRRDYVGAWTDQREALRRAGLDDAGLASACGGSTATWYAL